MKEEHQSSNLEVCKGLRTIENKFLQPGLALSGSLDILRRGAWKPVRHPPAGTGIGGPAQKSRSIVKENGGKLEKLKSK